MTNKSTTATVDLMNIKPSAKDCVIVHPATGEPIGLTITVLPITDDKPQATIRKVNDRRFKLAARQKSFTSEEAEANGYDIISSAITGWTFTNPELMIGGVQPPFSSAGARKLLVDLPWILSQLDDFLGDTARFFQN